MKKFLNKKGKIIPTETPLTPYHEKRAIEVKSISLSQLDGLAERGLGVLEIQLSKLESASRTGTFTYGQFELLKSILATIVSLKRSAKDSKPAADKQAQQKVESLEKELLAMGKEEVMALIVPYLDSMGIDINDLPLKKESKNVSQANPSEVHKRSETSEDGGNLNFP